MKDGTFLTEQDHLANDLAHNLSRARAGDRLAGLRYLVALASAGVEKNRRRRRMLDRKRAAAIKTLSLLPQEVVACERALKKTQAKLRKAKKRLAEASGQ